MIESYFINFISSLVSTLTDAIRVMSFNASFSARHWHVRVICAHALHLKIIIVQLLGEKIIKLVKC